MSVKSNSDAVPALRMQGLCLTFGGVIALDDVTLDIESGHITAIIGPNGAGKTSLFNCISGFYVPTSGSVFATGVMLDPQRPHLVVDRGIARTFQHAQLLLEESVVTNIKLGFHGSLNYSLFQAALRTPAVRSAERRASERSREFARLAGLGAVADRPVGELPYGHQKLTEICRALATEPSIILLDEPTAGMTAEEKDHVAALLGRVSKELNVTLVVIEHDVRFIKRTCDRAVAMDNGRVIGTGTPEEVLQDPDVLAAYMGEER